MNELGTRRTLVGICTLQSLPMTYKIKVIDSRSVKRTNQIQVAITFQAGETVMNQ